MKILHIIPSAFDYFNDIKEKAMSLAEKQKELGFSVEAFTVQYHGLTPKQTAEGSLQAPLLHFSGVYNTEEVISELSDFDIIHFHAPFLGIVGKICSLLKSKANKSKIVISYWRNPIINDLFSVYIYLYNRFYIPRLSALSDAQMFMGADGSRMADIKKWIKNVNNITDFGDEKAVNNNIPLTPDGNRIKLDIRNKEAIICLSVYNNLINN